MQTPQSKYAIAQINIPIEIFPNGEWINHNDRITIQIMRTSELPPISTIENQKIIKTIEEILGGSHDDPEQSPTKISFELWDEPEEQQDLPFTINLREPEPESIHETTQESPVYTQVVSESEHKPNTSDTSEPNRSSISFKYMNYSEFLHRKRRQQSKNTTFKRIAHPFHNKTRTNRWTVLKKDTEDAEY